MKGFSQTKQQNKNDAVGPPRLDEIFDVLKLGKEWEQVRLIGPITSYYVIWIPIKGKKTGKETNIPRLCIDYDPSTDSMVGENCPYRKAGFTGSKVYLANVIVRNLQESQPRKLPPHEKSEKKEKELLGEGPFFFKKKGSASWTPVRVVEIRSMVADKLKNLTALNKHEGKDGVKKPRELSDPKYGRDVSLRFDADAKGPSKYDVNLEGKKTPLTDEEKAFLIWNLDVIKMPSIEEVKTDYKNIKDMIFIKKDDEDDEDDRKVYSRDDDDDDDDRKSKKNKKQRSDDDDDDDDDRKSKKKKHSSDDEDDDEDIEEVEIDDDDDDDRKSKKNKKKSKKDEDDEDDDD